MLTTDGSWSQLEADPLKPYEELSDWEKGAEAAGYYQWSTFGSKDDNPLWLEVYRRHEKPELTVPLFMVVVSARHHYEVVYAESLPAMMELQSRWAPALQAAAVTELLGRLDDPATKHGFAGLVRSALT
ncbi:hypothetical protein ACFT8P_14020 [Streptomyces sp. NPDC057101]|uniref:hypothetical protein n=1 Tax=Streptomyces sp. NPDC057101 TaxID=3346020 RepID=UPI003637A93B